MKNKYSTSASEFEIQVAIANELYRANEIEKAKMWLIYNIHVDKLDKRTPSKFLTDGFVEVMEGL